MLIIIDSVGRYITRDDTIVLIDTIDGKGTASCKGYMIIEHTKKGKRLKKPNYEWNIWQPNGRFLFVGYHPKDIIAKWG